MRHVHALDRRVRRGRRLALGGLCLLLVWAWAAMGSSAGADCDCDLTVQPDESLQKAILQAPAGAVICLGEGIWRENLAIFKPVTLCGSGSRSTLLRGDMEGQPVIWVRVPYQSDPSMEVRIQDLSILGAYGSCSGACDGFDPNGIVIGGHTVATLDGVSVFENDEYGVWVDEHAYVTVLRSYIRENGNDGIEVKGSATLHFFDSYVGMNANCGAVASGSGKLWLERCAIVDNGMSGVILADQANCTLIDCRIERNGEVGVTIHLVTDCPPENSGEDAFAGTVSGYGNSIPSPDEVNGNLLGSFCPSDWPWPDGLVVE